MKVTIELTESQVKGLKDYLNDVSHDVKPKISKADIVEEIKGIVHSNLQSGAVCDFIIKYEN